MVGSKYSSYGSLSPNKNGITPYPFVPNTWYSGDDVPLTWEPGELKSMKFKADKVNFFRGNISKEEYTKIKLKFRGANHV